MSVSRPITPATPLVSRRRFDPWVSGKPSLQEVMADPIIHLVMRRDGLVADQVWPMMRQAQARLGRYLCRDLGRAA